MEKTISEKLLEAFDCNSTGKQFEACVRALKECLFITDDRTAFTLDLRDFILDILKNLN